MLSDYDKQLITGAVDEVLNATERQQFHRLLEAQAEARLLYEQLLDDSHRLKRYPLLPVPQEIAPTILQQVQTLPWVRSTPLKFRKTSRPRVHYYVVAFSLFCAVILGSFLVFSHERQNHLAQKQLDRLPPANTETPTLVPAATRAPGHREGPRGLLAGVIKPLGHSLPDWIARGPESVPVENAPFPRPAGGDVVGAGLIAPAQPLNLIKLNLPLLVSSADLSNPQQQDQLLKWLNQESIIRLDLFTNNSAQMVNLIQQTLKSRKESLIVEHFTAERLKLKLPLAYGFYSETWQPRTLLSFLTTVHNESQKIKDLTCEQTHWIAMSASDRKELQDLVGINERRQTDTREKPGQDLSENTLNEIQEALQRPKTPQSTLLLTYLPSSLRIPVQKSPELQAFRKALKPTGEGNLRLLLVVRPITPRSK